MRGLQGGFIHPPKENKRLDLEKVLEDFAEIKNNRDNYEVKDRMSGDSFVVSSRTHFSPDWQMVNLARAQSGGDYLNEESASG